MLSPLKSHANLDFASYITSNVFLAFRVPAFNKSEAYAAQGQSQTQFRKPISITSIKSCCGSKAAHAQAQLPQKYHCWQESVRKDQ